MLLRNKMKSTMPRQHSPVLCNIIFFAKAVLLGITENQPLSASPLETPNLFSGIGVNEVRKFILL